MFVKSKSRLRSTAKPALPSSPFWHPGFRMALLALEGIAPNLIALLIGDRAAIIGFLASVNAPPAAAKVFRTVILPSWLG